MMQLLMAGALAVLAAARMPVLIRHGSDTVFNAAVVTGIAATLTNPGVYLAVDPLLGGFNLTRLIFQILMVVGLWFLRTALLQAVAPDTNRKQYILYLAIGVMVSFFILLGPTTTTSTWGDEHESKLAGAAMSFTGIAFTAWICGDIAAGCMKSIPRLRGAFRPGFVLVAAGCALGSLTMAALSLAVLSNAVPVLTIFKWHMDGYRALELASIALVGVGLTLTAVTGHHGRRRIAKWERDALAAVEPIRERALKTAGLHRTLEADANAPVADRLHRMVVEIWDAELAAGGSRQVLSPDERAFLLAVEEKLDLNHQH